jgi:hypothetical protein
MTTRTMIEPIELTYDLQLLPRGRIAFRRWRFELWHGPRLLVGGWRLNALHAQRALREHALRYAHRVHGLHPLHPEMVPPGETNWAGQAVSVESGDLTVMLKPRALLQTSR